MKLTLGEISDHVNGQLFGNEKLLINGVSEIQNSRKGTITFLSNPIYKKYLAKTKSSAVLVNSSSLLKNRDGIVVENPQLAMAKTLELFFPKKKRTGSIHKNSNISKNSIIGEDVVIESGVNIMSKSIVNKNTIIGSNTFIGEHVKIGQNTIIHPNVTIYNDTIIGENVEIHSGSVIGSDGFGYVTHKNYHYKILQTGNVKIENNVEIGSNCSIDRGTIGSTLIGEGSKLDNLIHIAHNVNIGKGCLIAAQFGISGSTLVGDFCTFAGKVGVAGHIQIGPKSIFAAKSGVTKSLKGGKVYAGYPAREIREHNKREAIINKVSKIFKEQDSLKE